MREAFLFVLLLVLLVEDIAAQERQLKFTRINLLEDASLGQVNFITEDKAGFIWMSEQSGGALIRFDGHNIKRYSFNPQEENSLGGSYPECLLIDKDGYIWIGFGGFGLDRFDPQTETFIHYKHDPENPNSLGENTVSAIIQDREGKIYIATFAGMDILDPETGDFTHFTHDPNNTSTISSNYVRELYEDREGTIWVGTGWFTGDSQGGLNRFDKAKKGFVRYMADPMDPYALKDNRITALFEDSRNNFWVGTGEALYSLDRQNEVFTRHQSNPKDRNKLGAPFHSQSYYGVTFISEDPEGNLWIGGEGVNVYNPQRHTMVHYGGNSDTYGTFIENSSWCIHMGRNGLIWLSTQPGVYKIDPYDFTISRKEGMIPSMIMESDSITWTGSENGLIRTNERTGSQKRWTHDPLDPNSLSNNEILSLSKDSHGNLWIGTGYGLNKLNPQDGKITRFVSDPLDSFSISGNVVRDLVQDENDILWVGTERGLDRLSQVSGKFEIQRLRKVRGGELINISRICPGEEHILWIGEFASGSILRYNLLKKESTFYPVANGVNDLFQDHLGTIWAAAPSGLYKYEPGSDRFLGISHVPMIAITEDRDSNLWVSSVSDIFRINQSRDNIVKYTGQNSNTSRNLTANKASGYLTKEGDIFLGDADSYFLFDPKQIIIPPDTSRLIFTNLWIGGEPVEAGLSNAIFKNRDLELAHDQNTFSLSFAELDSRNPRRNKINYLLENYDLDWRACLSEDKITYMNVPPGTYNLKIRASNSSSGDWVDNNLKITLHPPWWTTWWAYVAYAILIIICGWRFDRFQKERAIRKEKERNKDRELAQAREIERAYKQLQSTQAQLIHSEKMASLGELTAGIAHEIQNPLNFVNNFAEVNKELFDELAAEIEKGDKNEISAILKDLRENEEKVIHHGKRADGIVKSMLQHSRATTGEKELTDMNALCDEYLRLAYHGFRAKDKSFNATFHTNLHPDLPKINVDPQDIGRVLLNLINNAFQATSAQALAMAGTDYKPEVIVATKRLDSPSGLPHQNEMNTGIDGSAGSIEIIISDNGPGIPDEIKEKIFQPFFTTKPAGQGTGLGLSLSYDIVKAHGGEISLESRGKGSTFRIKLPLGITD
ncbi:MAG: hypothetical protein KDC80_00305 [Saprospiraceae bacterium]|nr:hypothetical protein [Saprospiraceae bacterium]